VLIAYNRCAELDGAQAGLLVSREVNGEVIRAGVLLAGRVEGSVETILDTPRALLAGLASGVAVGLVLWVGSLLKQRWR